MPGQPHAALGSRKTSQSRCCSAAAASVVLLARRAAAPPSDRGLAAADRKAAAWERARGMPNVELETRLRGQSYVLMWRFVLCGLCRG